MHTHDTITLHVNEALRTIPSSTTLWSLRKAIKHDADITVLNGAPSTQDVILQQGDQVTFIKRGEVPGQNELEALMVARHSPGVHATVKQATIGIAGLGGLGSAIAIALARVGVGKMILADFDVVEPSNLNRQQYFVDQIGLPKTEALQQNLKRINPYVDLEIHTLRLTAENTPPLFSGVSIMVEAFDSPQAKAMLLETFAQDCPTIPLVMASGLAGFEPSNTIVTRKLGKNITLVGDLVTAAQPGTGLMAPRVGVAANHQANAVLRILLGEDPVS